MSLWIQGSNLKMNHRAGLSLVTKSSFWIHTQISVWADHNQVCSMLVLLFSRDFHESAGKLGRDCMRFGVRY